jgi:hypothetical protein
VASSLVKADAEREMAHARRMERENIFKEAIAKALYIPLVPAPLFLTFEKTHAGDGDAVVETAVVKKTCREQNHICIGNDIETIREFGRKFVSDDTGFTLNELLYIFEGSDTKGNVIGCASMKLLESLEKENILLIDREKQFLLQNPGLMENEFEDFLSVLRKSNGICRAVEQKLMSDFPELMRK